MRPPRPDTLIAMLALGVTAGTAMALPSLVQVSHLRILLMVDALAMLVLLLLLGKVRADRQAAASHRHLRLLADNAGDLVVRLEPDGLVQYASPAALTVCGLPPGALTSRNLADVVHVDDRATFRDMLRRLAASGEPGRGRVRIVRTDGRVRWVEIAARSVTVRRRGMEVHASLRDDTERHTAELGVRAERDHAEALAAGLEETRRVLERQNEALRRLVAERACRHLRRETLFRIGERLAGEEGSEAVARAILDGVEALTGASSGVVYALQEWGRPLQRVAYTGVTSPPPPEVLVHGHLDGPQVEPAGACPLAGVVHRPMPCLLLPLRRGGILVGAVWMAGDELCPDETRREELTHLATHAAVALDTARVLQVALRQARIVRAVVDADPDAICLVDPDGQTLMTNPPFRALQPLLGPDGVAGTDPANPDGDAPESVRELTLPGGDRTFVRYTAPVGDEQSAPLGRVFIHREVTAEREADRLKDEFLALVSHELRTPLTSVLGYLEVLRDGELGPLTDPQERAVGVVERNARRLRRLVGDLLVVAQAEAGRLAVLPEDADVAALAAERVAALRPVAAERAIRLQVDAPAPMHAFADPERLGQVLDNLIANAVTHTPDHGVVTVSTRRVGDDALVEVRDTGPGIPTEELERVFERFHRGVRSTRSGGIGLGLPISRAIMRAHGGDLWAESPAGGGAVLTLRLPVGAAAGDVTAPREPGIMAGA